jgi:hypothetical protein
MEFAELVEMIDQRILEIAVLVVIAAAQTTQPQKPTPLCRVWTLVV